MKKLICLLSVVLMVGCATTTYEKGDVKITVKRPIFAATNVSWIGDTGSISAGSSVQLDQMLSMMLTSYAKSQGIPINSTPVAESIPVQMAEPQAVLVPKAAQATPPPAEIPLVR